jgi:hypothetical protein
MFLQNDSVTAIVSRRWLNQEIQVAEKSLAGQHGSRRMQEKGLADQTQQVSKMPVCIDLLVPPRYRY